MFWNYVIDGRLDVVAFAAISLGVLAAVQAWMRRAHDAPRPRWAWIALLGLVALAGITAELSGRFERNRLIAMLEGIAPTYAMELARLGHADLSLDTWPDDPRYLAMIDAEQRWLAANRAVSDIYTFTRTPGGQVALLVDSETDYDRNGRIEGAREERTPIGEIYHEASPTLLRAFDGERVFDAVPQTDRWGTWVSAYVPMRDHDGEVSAVLGVDFAARDWAHAILRSRCAALGVCAVVAAVVTASTCMVSVQRTELSRRAQAEQALRDSEARLLDMALHDRLTGLPNRQLLTDRIEQSLLRASRHPDAHFAVLFLDFDRFKLVNDSLGHGTGDLLIQAIAGRLRKLLRNADTVARAAHDAEGAPNANDPAAAPTGVAARLGGDEFVVVLDRVRTTTDATLVAERLQLELSRPYQIGPHEIRSSASIGIACSFDSYKSAEDMLRDADTAMYHAKAAGRARHVLFSPSMHERALARLTMENDLRRALERGELSLAYQPIVNLADGEILGLEALVRWQHPMRGEVAPAEFIGVAEEAGLIVPMGAWVMEQACRQLAAWRQRFPHRTSLAMSVNVSRRQFTEPGFAEAVGRTLRQTGVDPRGLKLEITESVIMENPETAIALLARLRQMDLSLTIDDFGTGHSSLTCLHRFPISGVKIDRGFVSGIAEHRSYSAVVNAVVTLCANLNLELVAEGLETVQHAALLRSLGCERAQGYHFSRPLPPDEIEKLLAQAAPLRATLPTAA